ncbi:hypothetical protein SAMN04515667_2238 [Formosa sp. Hel1_31_208]|nr:hypothetical protein SAMN04515667_2238 [Formosa sp. Hel1_31_208]
MGFFDRIQAFISLKNKDKTRDLAFLVILYFLIN